MAGNSAEPGRSVTSKVAAILTSFTSGRAHPLGDLARQTGLPTSTAHRLARELADRHLLERTDDGEFRVGLPLRMLCGEVAHPPTLRERAPFVVDDLCEATRAAARLGVLDDLEVAYIERLPGHRPVSTFSAAARLPVHATALGKALLAFSPPQVVRMVLAPTLPAYTAATPTTAEQLHRSLQQVRLRGIATCRGELRPRACAVAVPVLDPCGTAIAAVGVDVADLEGPTLGRVVPALVLAARGLARELAADPEPGAGVAREHGAGRSAAAGPGLVAG
jgi:DNA-binding IclR family transcriptional regulator